jgi:cation transport regulator
MIFYPDFHLFAVRRNADKEIQMPYKKLSELPESITDNLPKHAQEIYLSAYNSAWEEYKSTDKRKDGSSREETANKVAWSAIKKVYEKDEDSGVWKKKAD